MPIFSKNKPTNRLLRDDITFIHRLIVDSGQINGYPLSPNGKTMLNMLWVENKSFEQVATTLGVGKSRVVQIYRTEIRRLTYMLDSTFRDFKTLTTENQSLKKENKELKLHSK